MNKELSEKLWKIANSKNGKSPYFISLEYGKPLDLKKIFSNNFLNYYLELGSGWGEVALELAEKNPDTCYILMEKNIGRVNVTLRKLQEKKLNNIYFLPMNFHWFLNSIFLPEQFSTILLNFPDPWPKKKHHKHRTLNSDFIDLLSFLLIKNGKFLFATDHGGYGRQAIRVFRNQDKFQFISEEYSFKRDGFPVSRFEEEKKKEGKRIYYLERIKK